MYNRSIIGSWANHVDSLASAMAVDAFNNEVHYEPSDVSIQDVSDCPDLTNDPTDFETCEDYFDDLAHEIEMEELKKYSLAS